MSFFDYYSTQELENDDSSLYVNSYEFKTPEAIRMLQLIPSDYLENKLIPIDALTDEIILIEASLNPHFLLNIPNRVTQEMCLKAVNQNVEAFRYIPDNFKTPEICSFAVSQDPILIYCVPNDRKTEAMCYEAVVKDFRTFLFIPEELRTPNICAAAILEYPKDLKHVPYQSMSYELCELAVSNNPEVIEFVPKESKYTGIYKLAVSLEPKLLYSVPLKLMTEEICQTAERKSPGAIGNVLQIYLNTRLPYVYLRDNFPTSNPEFKGYKILCQQGVLADKRNINLIPSKLLLKF